MSLCQCYDDKFEYIIKCHGITKDPITREVMFIMKYANGGNLHNYLQKNFTEITWKKKYIFYGEFQMGTYCIIFFNKTLKL